MVKAQADYLSYLISPNHYSEFREEWRTAAASYSVSTSPLTDLSNKIWFYTLAVADATQTLGINDPGPVFGAVTATSRSVTLDQGTSNNATHIQTLSTMYPIALTWATGQFFIEFDVAPLRQTGTQRDWTFGISTNTAFGANSCSFHATNASGNWFAGNGGVWTDSGVAIAIGSAFSRFKISMDKNLASVRYYINDALVLTDTANMPAAGVSINPLVQTKAGGTLLTSIAFGPIAARWTKF